MRGGPGYVQFHDGTRIQFDQPLNTLDPRYPKCTEHRVACDCREAEWSEEVRELTGEWQSFRKTLATVLAGHAACCCRCTGCEIARKLHLTHLASGDHCHD
jgi:hypothetical protein